MFRLNRKLNYLYNKIKKIGVCVCGCVFGWKMQNRVQSAYFLPIYVDFWFYEVVIIRFNVINLYVLYLNNK